MKSIGEQSFYQVLKSKIWISHVPGSYLSSTDIVLGIISNVEMIWSIREDVHRLYVNNMLIL